MSGRISNGLVDFTVFLFALDRVCCGSYKSFLVRNWCGCSIRGSGDEPSLLALPELTRLRRFVCNSVAGRVQNRSNRA
jgi:hypothetical protein